MIGVLVAWALWPKLDADAANYSELCEGLSVGSFKQIEDAAIKIEASTKHPDLRNLAENFRLQASLQRKMGHETMDQSSSLAGIFNSAVSGIVNPDVLLHSAMATIKGAGSLLSSDLETVNARYVETIGGYNQRKVMALVFGCLFALGSLHYLRGLPGFRE